jgi:PKD repeat protein
VSRGILFAGLALALAGCESLPNVPPTAAFVFSPVSPIYAGQTSVVFNADASLDSDGRITTYRWNFGDGTPEVATDTPTATHVFPATGSCVSSVYTVQLVVTDDAGDRSFASAVVTVLPPPGTPACTTAG